MEKLIITDEDREEFKKTINGKQKFLWLKIGIIIDIISTISVSLLNIFANRLNSSIEYYIILYIILVFVVVGGEFIGTYFGALEEYARNKKTMKKKEINYME